MSIFDNSSNDARRGPRPFSGRPSSASRPALTPPRLTRRDTVAPFSAIEEQADSRAATPSAAIDTTASVLRVADLTDQPAPTSAENVASASEALEAFFSDTNVAETAPAVSDEDVLDVADILTEESGPPASMLVDESSPDVLSQDLVLETRAIESEAEVAGGAARDAGEVESAPPVSLDAADGELSTGEWIAISQDLEDVIPANTLDAGHESTQFIADRFAEGMDTAAGESPEEVAGAELGSRAAFVGTEPTGVEPTADHAAPETEWGITHELVGDFGGGSHHDDATPLVQRAEGPGDPAAAPDESWWHAVANAPQYDEESADDLLPPPQPIDGRAALETLVRETDGAEHALEALEAVARMVRGGEIVVSVPPGASVESVMASLLAALLSPP